MKRSSIFIMMFFWCMSMTMAQKTITGTVVDDNDGPLIGASILVKGTSTGTVTDIDGKYNLEVDDSAEVLVFSYTGFQTQEITVGASNVIDVTLIQGTVLEEVVVTALGIERESRSLGYGVDQIDSKELTKAREANILNSLQGKVTGVQISNTGGNLGGSAKVVIRGVTSLSGRNNPLWVIDGQPFNDNQFASSGTGSSRITGTRDFGNGASVINPDDIENISVLKGAAATALYGSRAAAGAIIVTTKKGKSSQDGRASVSINSSVRFDELFVTPDYQQQYAMGDQAKYDSSAVGFDWGPRIAGQTVNYLAPSGESGPLRGFEDNGVKDFFETGQSFINNIAVSDGNEKMNYRLSFGALNQTGIVPASKLDRYNLSFNAGFNHSSKLKSSFGVQFIKLDSEGTAAAGANDPNIVGLTSFSSTLDQSAFIPWIDENGNQLNQPDPTSNNPYWIRNENRSDRDDTRILANAQLTFTPIENLDITGTFGYDFDQDNRLITNRKGTAQRLGGTFRVENRNAVQINTDIIARYSFDINDDISASVLGGFNYNFRERTGEFLNSTNLLVPEIFNPGNVEQNVPGRTFVEQILMGAYTSIDLSYRDWLTLTITGRNDWSSTLPLDNNSYFYPSVSAAFVFTDALGMESNILNYGKIRASYAQVGNDTDPYLLDFTFNPITTATGQYSLNNNFPFLGRSAYSKVNTVPPEGLLPENQISYEVGAELNFFDSRLNLDLAYFRTENTDQILQIPIPETTGFGFLTTNLGQVNTSGFEFSIDAIPLKFKKFRWNTIINFSSAITDVVELTEGLDDVIIASAFNSVQVRAVKGGTFELFAIPFERDSATGRPLINPNTGERIAGEARTFGSVLPDFTMGFVNSFDIGAFNLSFTIDWRSGGIMKPATVEGLIDGGLVTETLRNREGAFIDREGVLANADGTVRDNDIPVANAQAFWTSLNANSIGEGYIFDASFVKLREVAFNYTLPSSILGNSFIKNLTIGVEARNVALLYSVVPHIDPENNLFGSGADGFGIERNSTPTTRSFGFNLRANF